MKIKFSRFNVIFLFFIVNKLYLLNRIPLFCVCCRIIPRFYAVCCFILHSFFVVNDILFNFDSF